MTMTKDEIQERLTTLMVEQFEVERERIRREARLYEDLDIDSIDAVDLMVRLREITGKRINPDDFKNARTIQDVVDTVHRIVSE